MSALTTRLQPNAQDDIELNAYVFGTLMLAYLLGDQNAGQTRDRINTVLAADGYAILTATEESNIQSMKTHYDTLTDAGQHAYRDRVVGYSQLLQDAHITATEYDNVMNVS